MKEQVRQREKEKTEAEQKEWLRGGRRALCSSTVSQCILYMYSVTKWENLFCAFSIISALKMLGNLSLRHWWSQSFKFSGEH